MPYNAGFVSASGYSAGYVGTYTGGTTYPYVLTSHGDAHPNSIAASANFATNGDVELRIVSDFDSAKVVFDWQAFSDSQLWRQDINTLAAVTVNATADTTDSATIGWKVPDGTEGQYNVNLQINESGTVTVTAPTITSVSVPTSGSYKASDTLSFTVNFSEAVNVTVVPALNLSVGGSARQANYASGTGTSALVFSYTVQAGDNDADGIGVTGLSLDGGTIKDAAGNDATLTLNSVADTSGILVDTTRPVITPTGDNPYYIVQGETYTDPGATAFDDQAGSLGSVTGTGTVDTATIGEYTVTYPGAGVVDAAGNVAEDATRTVNVVEELPEPVPTTTRRKRSRRIVRQHYMRTIWASRFREEDE